MSRKKKRLIISVIIFAFICVVAYTFRPISFSKDFFKNDTLSIVYFENSVVNGAPIQNSKVFDFDSAAPEFQQIKQIFEKYSYHNCFDTLKSGPIKNGYQGFSLSSEGEMIMILNVPKIFVGDKIYRIGYWGSSEINALNVELKDILNIEANRSDTEL